MSVDTKGLIKGNISPEEITNILQQKGYINVGIMRKDKMEVKECGTYYSSVITFDDKDDKRMIFVLYDTYQGDVKTLVNEGEDIDLNNIYTQISLGFWNNSEKIIKDIIDEYGGYIDVNDCDDIGYKPIKLDSKSNTRPVINVTMKDIYIR